MDGNVSLEEAFIIKLTKVILDNLENDHFGVEELSSQMGMSHSTIHRKLKAYKNLSICQFVKEVRLNRAHEMLQQNLGTISEISYKVGFSSPTYFDKCFHEHYGYPPGEVKRQDMKNAVSTVDGIKESDNSEVYTKLSKKEWSSRLKEDLLKTLSLLMLMVLLWIAFLNFPEQPIRQGIIIHSATEKSIAVLPFRNLSTDRDNQYFVYGITLEMVDYLNKIKELRVVRCNNSDNFYKNSKMVSDMAKKLNVSYLLDGSAQKSGNKVRVIVRLTDARNGKQIWSKKYNEEMKNIFSIQSEIAMQVAGKLKAFVSDDEVRKIKKQPAKNVEAYSLYLQGLYFWNIMTEESLEKSIFFFEDAINKDPDYALAYAGIADSYFTLTYLGYYPAPQGYNKAKEYAVKSLNLDPDIEEAYTTLGGISAWGDLKWNEACNEFEHAVSLNPDYPRAHLLYSEVLHILGRDQEERIHINKYLELNPFSAAAYVCSLMNYYDQGMFKEALDEWETINELNLVPYNPYGYSFYIYMYMGDDANAIESVQKYLSGSPLYAKHAGQVRNVYDKSGIMGILKWLNEIELSMDNPDPWLLAKRYAMLGMNDKALDWLELAYKKNNYHIPGIYNSYDFIGLRREPRFKELLRLLGLPDYRSANDTPDGHSFEFKPISSGQLFIL